MGKEADRARYARNREQFQAAGRAYYARNKDRMRERRNQYYRNNTLKWRNNRLKKYGMCHDDYEMLLAIQGGHCALCPTRPAESRDGLLHVDHCHTTGKVRGLLCSQCNLGLGAFKDDAEQMRRAAQYIES